jgi:RNA polymerase sigma factor (sigma-70 family)
MKSSKTHDQSEMASHSLEELELEHLTAVQSAQNWQEVLNTFYANRWFRQTLRIKARKAVKRSGLPRGDVDDIYQEALFEFSRALQRRTSLGFDPSRGGFSAFIGVVIHRCCLKALRQFRHRHLSLHEDELFHPYYEEQSQLEKVMDLREMARELPEPYRGIVRQVCFGRSVDEIAARQNRSKRTIYRWIDRSIELMKQRYFES